MPSIYVDEQAPFHKFPIAIVTDEDVNTFIANFGLTNVSMMR